MPAAQLVALRAVYVYEILGSMGWSVYSSSYSYFLRNGFAGFGG